MDFIGGGSARGLGSTLAQQWDPKTNTIHLAKPGWTGAKSMENNYRAWGATVDNETALPLGGVRINVYKPDGTIYGDTYVSDGTGNWSLWIPSDSYILSITKDGFKEYTNPAYIVSNGYRLFLARSAPIQTEPKPMPAVQEPVSVDVVANPPAQTVTVADNSAVYEPGVSEQTPASTNVPDSGNTGIVPVSNTTVKNFGYGYLIGAGVLYLVGRSQKWW
jgi:hypothetical protein